jgi:agmatinase
MLFTSVALLACASCALAHANHDQTPVSGPHKSLWYNTLPGDGGTQVSKPQEEARNLLTIGTG